MTASHAIQQDIAGQDVAGIPDCFNFPSNSSATRGPEAQGELVRNHSDDSTIPKGRLNGDTVLLRWC